MIENKKIKNLSCNYTSSLKKKKKLSLELERCLVDASYRTASLYTRTFKELCCTYLCTEDTRLLLGTCHFLRLQNRCLWDSSRAHGPRTASCRVCTMFQAPPGERWAGPSQLRPLPLYRQRAGGMAQRTQKVFRWASSVGHEQIGFRLAQLIPNSRFEFGLPFRGLN